MDFVEPLARAWALASLPPGTACAAACFDEIVSSSCAEKSPVFELIVDIHARAHPSVYTGNAGGSVALTLRRRPE